MRFLFPGYTLAILAFLFVISTMWGIPGLAGFVVVALIVLTFA